MQKYLDERDTIGEIRQSRRHPLGKFYVWVLVEGITDQKLYSKLLNGESTKVEMVHGGGLKELREAMQVLQAETDRVLGIRDADFLHLEQQPESIDHLFLTDGHDAEMMLLACDTVMQHVLSEYLPAEANQFACLRMSLLRSLAFLGGIRWLNAIDDLTLKLNDLGLADFYDAAHFALDKVRCIRNIEMRSRHKKRSIQVVEVEAKVQETHDYYNLCNGHDVVKALALYLSAKQGKGIKDDEIARVLRVAYRQEDFAMTRLYASLKTWEIQMGYKLFKA